MHSDAQIFNWRNKEKNIDRKQQKHIFPTSLFWHNNPYFLNILSILQKPFKSASYSPSSKQSY